MPVILKVDSLRRVVYSTFYGKVTEAELVRHGFTIASDPDFKREFSEIVDFSEVTELSISDAALNKLASTPSLFSRSVRHVIVASTEPGFQIASRFKAMSSETRPNVIVVRTRAEAYELLGIRPDSIQIT